MPNAVFLEAATLLLREGLEAILVLSALAAYLTRAGAADRLGTLYAGAGLAVLASIAMAWVFETFFGGVHNDMIEGVVIVIAAGLMFYVSGWLFLKQDPRAWTAYLKQHTDRVVEGGTLMAVGLLSFLAVFREGAETVLFLHALALTKGGWTPALLAGIASAGVALVGLFVLINRLTRPLPLRWVFLVTSTLLFAMGLKFVGEAIQEFQEQALIDVHAAPFSDTLMTLGLNPSWEAIAAQLFILAIAVGSAMALSMRRPAAVASR